MGGGAQDAEPGRPDRARHRSRYETRVYFGEQSPDYSIVGKAVEDASDVELDLPSGDAAVDEDEVSDATTTTTYDGDGGVPVGSFFNQLMYAVKFGEPNFLLSERVNDNSEVHLQPRPRASGSRSSRPG